MSDFFEDERGWIFDLIGPVDAVTRISTVKGAIRGNHVHHRTRQWTFVVSGSLRVMDGATECLVGAGEMVVHDPGVPHAWQAVEDTDCLVFTRGPRSGQDYETDTFRLEEPLLT